MIGKWRFSDEGKLIEITAHELAFKGWLKGIFKQNDNDAGKGLTPPKERTGKGKEEWVKYKDIYQTIPLLTAFKDHN